MHCKYAESTRKIKHGFQITEVNNLQKLIAGMDTTTKPTDAETTSRNNN